MSTLQHAAQKQLRQMVESLERLEEEKKALGGDIRDKYLEAKGLGFDVKILRQVIRLRKKSKVERDEEDSILDTYLHALGMQGDLFESDAETSLADEVVSNVVTITKESAERALRTLDRVRETEAAE